MEMQDDKNNKADFMGQRRVEGIWEISRRSSSGLFGGAHDCG
jgi:hypothetical protein